MSTPCPANDTKNTCERRLIVRRFDLGRGWHASISRDSRVTQAHVPQVVPSLHSFPAHFIVICTGCGHLFDSKSNRNNARPHTHSLNTHSHRHGHKNGSTWLHTIIILCIFRFYWKIFMTRATGSSHRYLSIFSTVSLSLSLSLSFWTVSSSSTTATIATTTAIKINLYIHIDKNSCDLNNKRLR